MTTPIRVLVVEDSLDDAELMLLELQRDGYAPTWERVETAEQACAARYTMGPYASEAQAQRGLEQVRHRNELWDAEDAAWRGDTH